MLKQCIIEINIFGAANYLFYDMLTFMSFLQFKVSRMNYGGTNLALGIYLSKRGFFLLFLWDKKYFPSNALPSDEYFSWAFHLSILWNCLIWKYFAISRRILHKNHTQKMCKTLFERLLPNLIIYFMSRNILFETWWWFLIQYPPFR